MAAPRKYPKELRERAIRLVLEAKKAPSTAPGACRRIGEQLGINPETLRGWVQRAEIDAGTRLGTATADAERRAELEREKSTIDVFTPSSATSRPPSVKQSSIGSTWSLRLWQPENRASTKPGAVHPWYVRDLPSVRGRAQTETPEAFRRRGVFITSGALERA